jgi:hypothetical protein
MKKTIIKDGVAIRVNEVVAEQKVRDEGFQYCPKTLFKVQERNKKEVKK